MKTSSKKIMTNIVAAAALAAITMTGNAAFAQTAKASTEATTASSLKVKIEEIKPLQFRLMVENPLNQQVNIALEDNQTNILYDEYSILSSKYSRIFDLSNVADGTYSFVVTGKKDKIEKTFEIVTKTSRTALVAKNEK